MKTETFYEPSGCQVCYQMFSYLQLPRLFVAVFCPYILLLVSTVPAHSPYMSAVPCSDQLTLSGGNQLPTKTPK